MIKNNKGFSLVELIVTFAIISIIGLAVAGFMSVSNRQFKTVSNDVGLQYDQQVVVNQIRDYILESSDAIYYDNDDQALYVFKQTDEKVEPDPADPTDLGVQYKYSVSKLRFDNPNGTKNPGDEGYDDTLTGTIYVANKLMDTFNESDDAATAYKNDLADADAEKILGSNVQSITYDLTEAVSHKKVSFDITFYAEGKSFKSHQVVSLRNTITNSDQLGLIYETTSSTISSSIESVSILRNGYDLNDINTDASLKEIGKYGTADVTVQLGYDVKISAASKYAYTKAVNWSIIINPDSDNISISQDGKITVKANATAGVIRVQAESKDDKNKICTADLTITDNGSYPSKAELTDKLEKYNGYTEYVFLPKVTYSNSVENTNVLSGDELLTGNMKIEWHLSGDKLPGEKYGIECGIDDKTGKLILSEDAIGKTYNVWFTVKELKYDGEECKSNVITIKPTEEDIKPYESPEALNLFLSDTCSRNDSEVATLSWVNMPEGEIKYYWKIVGDADNTTGTWYDVTIGAISTNFEKTVSFETIDSGEKNYFKAANSLTGVYGDFASGVDGSGWYESSANNRSATIDIASFLYWGRAYKIKVMAFAIGTTEDGTQIIYDASGVHYVADENPKPIDPVTACTVAPKVQFILNESSSYTGNPGYVTGKVIRTNSTVPGEQRAFNYRTVGYSINNTDGNINDMISNGGDIKTHYTFYNSGNKKVNINKTTGSKTYATVGESRVDKEELSNTYSQFMFTLDIRKVVDGKKTEFYTYNPQTMNFYITLNQYTEVDGVIIQNKVDSNKFDYNLSYK